MLFLMFLIQIQLLFLLIPVATEAGMPVVFGIQIQLLFLLIIVICKLLI